MFKRFISGLFHPTDVANYLNDKKRYTVLFFFLLVLISIIPNILILTLSTNLTYDDRLTIRNVFRNEEVPFEIIDGELVSKTGIQEKEITIEQKNLKIVFTTDDHVVIDLKKIDATTVIIFAKHGISFQQSLYQKPILNYIDYSDLQNLDFIGAKNDDQAFWFIIFPIINEQIQSFKPLITLIYMSSVIISNIIVLLVYSLLFAMMLRTFYLQGQYKFSQIWQLVIYIMTPYILGILLDILFGARIFSFIGLITTFVYGNMLVKTIEKKV